MDQGGTTPPNRRADGEDMSLKPKDKSPFKELTQQLNAASRKKKAELVAFCEKALGMTK